MDIIRKDIRTLITENSVYIKVITEYPRSSTTQDFTHFKELKTFDECNTERVYNIIKCLMSTKGIRSIHPVWFFIHKKRFEKDHFIFKETLKNNIDVLNVQLPKNVQIPHRIQIIKTLEIYYTLILNRKIQKCFFDNDSQFITKYPEFKTIWKSFYFPIIENKCNRKYIDFTYNFNDIIEPIHLEINEPHHNITSDKLRENDIFFNSNYRLIHYYVNKDTLETIINKVFFRLTKCIFNVNKFAGLTFNAFINGIIDNLTIVIFFSELKQICLEKKLTWQLFLEKCNLIQIDINDSFKQSIIEDLKNDEEPEELEERLNELFYKFTNNSKDKLTETGYDYFLMQLRPKQTTDFFTIKCMYSKYRQEYEKIMTTLLSNEFTEKDMIKKHANLQIKREKSKFQRLQDHIQNGFKLVRNT